MSHYSNAPRRSHVIVHHTGSPNAHQDSSTNFCYAGYDFHIRYGGNIVVCGRWDNTTGEHAIGCNCEGMGIMLNGCFGGCSSGNLQRPSDAQECSLAYLVAHLKTPDYASRIVPHRHCYYWNPCNSSNPTSTVCCGTNLTSPSTTYHWDANGADFRDRVRTKRRHWDACCTCETGCNCPQ